MNRAQRRAAQRRGHQVLENDWPLSAPPGRCAYDLCSTAPAYLVVGQADTPAGWEWGVAHVCPVHLGAACEDWPEAMWRECRDPSEAQRVYEALEAG